MQILWWVIFRCSMSVLYLRYVETKSHTQSHSLTMGTIKTRQLSDHILEKIVVLVFISFHTGINIFSYFLFSQHKEKRLNFPKGVCVKNNVRERDDFFLFFCFRFFLLYSLNKNCLFSISLFFAAEKVFVYVSSHLVRTDWAGGERSICPTEKHISEKGENTNEQV